MTDALLQGFGVLVTRPRAQAAELVAAIEDKGGRAFCFPVIEIIPRGAKSVEADAAQLPAADIAIFISRNAVTHGLQYAAGAKIAAIGPATAAAIKDAGHTVDIQPAAGFDSESLLNEPVLQDISGQNIRIIRGSAGRGLLADTLRERGANVDYLSVYERVLPEIGNDALSQLEADWLAGRINAITVMSIETLDNLLAVLPDSLRQKFAAMPLVTPAARVLKEVHNRYSACNASLASGTEAGNILDAIIALHRTDPD